LSLVPIGEIPLRLLEELAAFLGEVFGCSCTVADPIPIPQAAWDARRRQYRGPAVLAALGSLDAPGGTRILGVIDADCYAPGLNFIFGQASLNGRDAFIALPRLHQSFYGLPEDEALFRERVKKEAVHELGHTFGLGHCPEARCVMRFSNSLYDTDVKGATFCPRCKALLCHPSGWRGVPT
ncbi:MAG: archaemetzincin family Zn-dependent metalloprotease, partial [Anaerolineae bacterium]|nr:archaemetzincin family Zn-dependent metalloprotease [Anaerolineae bacterium]